MSEAFRGGEVITEYARTLIRVKAKQIVRRPGFSRSDQADVEQDLALHLLSQAECFDPARGSFNTFVANVVNSAAAMLVRERKRMKRSPVTGTEVQSLEEHVERKDGPPEPLWAVISHSDRDRRLCLASLSDAELLELAESVESTIAALPPELQQVCQSLLERNRLETERELGLSRRNYEAAIDLIRQHFAERDSEKS